MSRSIILVTSASSGFGLMAAKALAGAGYTVYASMRETKAAMRLKSPPGLQNKRPICAPSSWTYNPTSQPTPA